MLAEPVGSAAVGVPPELANSVFGGVGSSCTESRKDGTAIAARAFEVMLAKVMLPS